jgi:peptidoglycan/xylan/chitin deacetylase (PgdA/CDA1 family)
MDGFWRMLDVLHRHKLRACCCLNLEILDHFPEIKDAMVAANWDYMAHGLYNSRPIYDLSEDEERAYCQDFDNGRYPLQPIPPRHFVSLEIVLTLTP